MPERDEDRPAERVDRLIEDVLGGRHLQATPSDAAEHQAIRAAAGLAGARAGHHTCRQGSDDGSKACCRDTPSHPG